MPFRCGGLASGMWTRFSALCGGYEIRNLSESEKTLGDAAAREMEARFGIRCEEALAMAFMEARPCTAPSPPGRLTAADEGDMDGIYACMER